jgi:putative ABC transport system substrate-binding protein
MVLLAAGMLAAAGSDRAPAAAQEARVYRLGLLTQTQRSIDLTRSLTLPELARLGFAEVRDFVLEVRVGDAEAMPRLARDLVAARPDAIIAISNVPIRAAYEATRTVPIVMFGTDPVGEGFAASLARPGGNVTGVAILAAELDAKRLELLHEAVPAARIVAALHFRAPARVASAREMRARAASAGVEFLAFDVGGSGDYPAAFAGMRAGGAQVLAIAAHSELFRDADQLCALALEARLPTIGEWSDMARSGCMLGYGPSQAELRRRIASFVARVFRGAVPGELPIEQPTRFELAINLRTARALAITVPEALLARADEVIE